MAEPRQIAGMVESSMGAGGQMMPEDDLEIEVGIEDEGELMPDGVELMDEEDLEVEAEPYDHGANLAEVLDDSVLGELSSDLQSKVREDLESREDWEEAIAKGLGLLGINYEDRSAPFLGASGVTHPLLSEAVTQFQAQAYKEMLPSDGPIKTKILGTPTKETEDQARRVQDFMNYQITEIMEEYDPDTDQMLFYLPLTGSTFKKVYFDETKQRAVSKFVPAEDMLVPYSASDLRTAEKEFIEMLKYLKQMIAKMKVLSKDVLMSCWDYAQTILMTLTPCMSATLTWIWKVLKTRIWRGILRVLCCLILSPLIRVLEKCYLFLETLEKKTH
jgi:hypothetical protein